MKIIKFIKSVLNSYTEQIRTQKRLNILLVKRKKDKCIKTKIPKKYLFMIELLAFYGITDYNKLNKILKKEITKNEKCDFCSKEAISALSHNMCEDHWNEYYEFRDRK